MSLEWITLPVKRFLRRQKLKRQFCLQTRAIQITTAFIRAHQQAQAQLTSYLAVGQQPSPEEACVLLESQIEVYEAGAMVNQITKPIQKRMNAMFEIHRLCEHYRQFILSALDGGVVQAKEAEALMHPAGEVLQDLTRKTKRIGHHLAKECGDSGVEHLLRVAAALEIQLAFRDWRAQRARREAEKNMPRLLNLGYRGPPRAEELMKNRQHSHVVQCSKGRNGTSLDGMSEDELPETTPEAGLPRLLMRYRPPAASPARSAAPGSPNADNFCDEAGLSPTE